MIKKILGLEKKFSFLIICLLITSAMSTISLATSDDASRVQISKDGGITTVKSESGTVIYSGTEDVDAIEEGLKSINNGIILFKKGTYNIDRTVLLKSGVSFTGDEGVKFNCRFNGIAFNTEDVGYSSSTILLSNDAYSRNTQIKLLSVSGLKVGDYIKISDDFGIVNGDLNFQNGKSVSINENTYFRNGEIVKIISIDGTKVTIDRPLYDSYSTAKNAKVRDISMFKGITFDNIDFVGYGMETESAAIYLYGAQNCKISNCEFTEFGDRAVNFNDCLDCIVEKNVFRRVFLPGTGYSVSLGNACDNIIIRNNSFLEKGRHYIAVGSGKGPKTSDGMCRNVSVANNVFANCTDEAINTHPATRSIFRVVDNKFYSCIKGVEFSNSDSIIKNNTFVDCVNAIETYGTGSHLIEGNNFQGNKISCMCKATSIIKGNLFNNGGYILPVFNVVIEDNTFNKYSEPFIYSFGASNEHMENITIVNNFCEDKLPISIKLGYCKDVSLSKNKLKGFIELMRCSNIRITNNKVDSSQSCGVRIWNAEGAHDVIANSITANNAGILLENTGEKPITHKITIAKNSITASTAISYKGTYSNVITELSSNNQIPIASAGLDRTVTTGETVTLRGSDSTDDTGIQSYVWDFDLSDGLQKDASGETVQHTYNTAGTYTVTLVVTDIDGSTDSDTAIINVNPLNPVSTMESDLSASTTSGNAPLTVTFTDKTTGSPTAWKWSFGDGTYSTEKNPAHTYAKAGTCTVILTASNSAGSSTITKSNYITVTANTTTTVTKPVVSFWASRTSGKAPLTIGFTDASKGSPTAWKWSFGDGTYSTAKNPKHTYSKAGVYSVTLTVSNEAGSVSKTRTKYIKVTK